MTRFDELMARFGVLDLAEWSSEQQTYVRMRVYDDGAWLASRCLEPIYFWGA